MRHLDTNDWLMMNGMIYKIYTMEDEKKMRQDFLEQLKLLIDFDAADFYLASDTQDTGLTDPVSCNCDCVSGEYDGLDYSRGLLYGGRSMVYRETDLVDDENRKKSSYYQKVYKPNNWHYSMQMILAKDKQFLGVITLYRAVGKENFAYDDIFLAELLVDHLSFRLDQERKRRLENAKKWTVSQAAEHFLLTRREEMVLRRIMEGKEREEICEELSISVNTLKKHTVNIYRKLGVGNRVQLFKKILERE
ncbi:MAG: response regulator transcription factor [Lachnospiraceae bacterium]